MKLLGIILILFFALTGCQAASPTAQAGPKSIRILAVETFLADIAQNVAGDRSVVEILVPAGVDPHSFEPGPQDIARLKEIDVLILNGAGLEGWLEDILQNHEKNQIVVRASEGLVSRSPQQGELSEEAEETGHSGDEHADRDPHFWLDPNQVIWYVENIQAGLSQADPDGREAYGKNAEEYIRKLKELDGWIEQEVQTIPQDKRLLVTNHEAFGYYADRYGFQIIGTVIPGVSTESSPTAMQMADLVDRIRSTQAKAIFIESSANPQLAEQIGQETGVKVVEDLYIESLSGPGGPAPTYIEMMKYNTRTIVGALQ